MRSAAVIPVLLLTFFLLSSCTYGPFSTQTRVTPSGIAVHPNDPRYQAGEQWYLEMIYAPAAWGLYQAVAEDPVSGPDVQPVRVAVIDTGIDGEHPDLRDSLAETGVDLTDGLYRLVPDGFDSTFPGIEHGTHVAGLIAATGANDTGIAGVASGTPGRPAAEIVAIRTLTSATGTLQDLIEGVAYAGGLYPVVASPRARVINMSLGFDADPDTAESLVLASLVEEVAYRGVVLVAASGNDATDVSTAGIEAPAVFQSVIAVGSVDPDGVPSANPTTLERSYFSDYGDQLELVAPGALASSAGSNDGILSTLPGRAYGLKPGTSMATPIAAGVAALVWSANPHLSAEQVRTILRSTATDLNTPGWDSETGYGLVNAEAAVRAAVESPYGRFSSSSTTSSVAAPVGAPSPEDLRESKSAFSYDYTQRRNIICVVDSATPPEAFFSALPEVLRAPYRPIGALSVGTMLAIDVSGVEDLPALVETLRSSAEIVALSEDLPVVASTVPRRSGPR